MVRLGFARKTENLAALGAVYAVQRHVLKCFFAQNLSLVVFEAVIEGAWLEGEHVAAQTFSYRVVLGTEIFKLHLFDF